MGLRSGRNGALSPFADVASKPGEEIDEEALKALVRAAVDLNESKARR